MTEQSRAAREERDARIRAQIRAQSELSIDDLVDQLNRYPGYASVGIRVVHASDDALAWTVEMPLSSANQNYFGTHFGGSLYAMCDPFFALILTRNLGPNYIVWDKSAAIQFKRPGTGRVRAHFELPQREIDEIKARAVSEGVERRYTVDVVDEDGRIVAEVEKIVFVRKNQAPVD